MIARVILAVGISLFYSISLNAQSDWGISKKESEKVSPFKFDETVKSKGEEIFSGNCAGCHGQLGKANFAPLVPEPGDPATDRFQNQSDGTLFHKIRNGRGAMPSFKDKLSEEERWSLIAYIRSGNENYVQPEATVTSKKFDLGSIPTEIIQNLSGDSINVTIQKPDSLEGLEATIFAKRWFGNLPLGKSYLSEGNSFTVPFDKTIPGDSIGNIDIILRLSLEGSGRIEIPKTLKIGAPKSQKNILDGRHMWSVRTQAPIWLYIAYFGIVFGVWGTMGYVVLQLFKFKK